MNTPTFGQTPQSRAWFAAVYYVSEQAMNTLRQFGSITRMRQRMFFSYNRLVDDTQYSALFQDKPTDCLP